LGSRPVFKNNGTESICVIYFVRRDWRGLAELAGVTGESMSYLEMKGNPLQELLKMLPTVSNSRLKTVKDLKAFLAIIDRYDVVDDGESLLGMTARLFSSLYWRKLVRI